MDHLSKQWSLKSLTIGPQIHETNTQFWEEAFKDLPPLPDVDNITIIYCYPTVKAFNTDCWKYFDRLLIRRDLFPALKSVDVQPSFASQQFSPQKRWDVYASMRATSARGLGPERPLQYICNAYWAAQTHVSGQGKLLGFKRRYRTDSPYKNTARTHPCNRGRQRERGSV